MNLQRIKIKKQNLGDHVYHSGNKHILLLRFLVVMLIVLYLMFALGDFIGPYSFDRHEQERENLKPADLNKADMEFLSRGEGYKLFGFIRSNLHLISFAGDGDTILGTDKSGRDIFSLVMRAGFVIGWLAVFACVVSGILSWLLIVLVNCRLNNDLFYKFYKIYKPVPGFLVLLLVIFVFRKLISESSPVFYVFTIFVVFGTFRIFHVMVISINDLHESGFVKFARFNQADKSYIFNKHIRRIAGRSLVRSIFELAGFIVSCETILSFLGIGLNDASMSFGAIIQQSLGGGVFRAWQVIPPCFFVIVLCVFFTGISKCICEIELGEER